MNVRPATTGSAASALTSARARIAKLQGSGFDEALTEYFDRVADLLELTDAVGLKPSNLQVAKVLAETSSIEDAFSRIVEMNEEALAIAVNDPF